MKDACSGSDKKKRLTIKDIIDEVNAHHPDSIDYSDKAVQSKIFNIMEFLLQSYVQLTEENKSLKDEINRLKGEKGRPDIKPNVPKKENDIPEQKEKKKWSKGTKNDKINIDRTVIIPVDSNDLPADAVFKGYRDFVVQNLIFSTDNVMYRQAVWYSKSGGRTIVAPLPEDVNGHFGSELKAFVYLSYFGNNVSEYRIHGMLNDMGISISEGQISGILTHDHADEFFMEKQEVYEEGMKHARTFGIDDTGGRHMGRNVKVHAISTLLMTVFFIMPGKSRETVECILNLSNAEWRKLVMMSDDARQFWNVTIIQALCWIHEIRHYRKLNPLLDRYRKTLREFITDLWKYYRELAEYRINPTPEKREMLKEKFKTLFTSESGYAELDWRKKRTMKHMDKLLVVLDYPFVPLHNNGTELPMRIPVMKRNVSYGTRSDAGKAAWETMFSLKDTCRKLDVNFYAYLLDRFSGREDIPRLSKIIAEKASVCS